MGLYVEPQTCGKEQWLEENGTEVHEGIGFVENGENLIVCLVDNYHFLAAAVAYDDKELDRFKFSDNREKKWYLVPKEKLKLVCPSYNAYVK